MDADQDAARDDLVLVLAPTGRDMPLTCALLRERAQVQCAACASVAEMCAEIRRGAGVVVVAEEALGPPSARQLSELLSAQPPWSDLPVLILARDADTSAALIAALRERGNITVLERPVRIVTLVSAVQSALRARRRQYEVRDLLRQQQAAVRQRDQFLAMLGHELRNPLATIANAMSVLDLACPPDHPAEREHRQMIARQTQHLARLVDDLLDVERITTGKTTLRLERLDLSALARRAVEAVSGLIRAQRHDLSINAPQQAVLVNADPIRLEQVVNNLLTNAIKYTPAGGRITVSVQAPPGSDHAELRVRDNGIGIARELVPKVFELFTQAERSLDRAQGGLGIGLTLVRSLVEMHGGTVRAHSDGPDTGSEFVVSLPLAAAPGARMGNGEASGAAPAEAEPSPLESSATPRRFSRAAQRVLVIEDHEDARRSLQRLLQLWGHTVHVAADGLAGVSLATTVRPHIALVDIGLPGLDGYEVARRIRAEAGDSIHLIALTGYGQPEDQARARAAGFDLHLVKPITADHLATMLDRYSARSASPGVEPVTGE